LGQLKVAIAQLNPTIGDLQGNSAQILAAARTAAAQGVNLLLTPELSLCGYPPQDLLLRPSFIATAEKTLQTLAAQLPPGLMALVGLATPNPNAGQQGQKPLFNSAALIANAQVERLFHKRLLPTYDVFDEDRYFESGDQVNWITLNDLRIGITICEDLWNDADFWGKRTYAADPFGELVAAGVDLVVNLSASPYSQSKQRLREAMLSHSVKRYSCPLIYVNQVGGNDELIFDGSSIAFNCHGEPVVRAAAFAPDYALVTCVEGDLQPGVLAPLLPNQLAETWAALVLGVQDYARKCGFGKAVLGLSGGIDSALVAAIATAALGPDNVLGVLMPSPYSSDHSVKDALALANCLGIRTETLAIGPLMNSFDQTLGHLFAATEPGVAEENIQSRIRGTLLMAIANKFGHLLLSTGNKSEMAVGYCTLYGDMNGGLAVIADLPKTQVYQICQWLNQLDQTAFQPEDKSGSTHKMQGVIPEIIPANILTKPPSAELKPGQVDQDSLPSYEVLDDILQRLIQAHESAADMVAAGHDPLVVEKVIRLVSRAEFKRRQAPPVLKVTDRAFGTGWRMPIASQWSLDLSP
jgi:NAD+ synthase (glutamine-hydrolysing)